MQDPVVKSAIRGLFIGHIALGIAGGLGVTLFILLAYTQAYSLVVIFPVVALAVVTAGALYLLRLDATRRERDR
jgi:threonine/homoserine/homoserine lactone efflux protein